jgi:hypothetical protein
LALNFITRPLQSWPRPITKNRLRSPYSLNYLRTLEELEREIINIGGRGDVVIQMDLREGQTRRDGLPYADVRPSSPRVAIAFTCKHGPLTYYCDRFLDWQSNVRAIGLGLHRLRLVEETGIVSRGEQYTGFKALPAGIELGPAVMTVEQAARAIVVHMRAEIVPEPLVTELAGHVLTNPSTRKEIYRQACLTHHHDRGGKPEAWQKVQDAWAVLEKHFNETGGGR